MNKLKFATKQIKRDLDMPLRNFELYKKIDLHFYKLREIRMNFVCQTQIPTRLDILARARSSHRP